MNLALFLNQTFGFFTIVIQLASILLVVYLLTQKPVIMKKILQHGLVLAFLAALAATIGSLTYSDIVGYEPCKLCWLQRIFMYPQVILLGMALIKKDNHIVDYSIVLSVVGAIIAAYHYLLQLGFAPALPCSATGYSVSCSQRFVLQYGYITLPMMALTIFVFMGLLLYAYKRVLARS